MLDALRSGYNGTILAYGPTGSGKRHARHIRAEHVFHSSFLALLQGLSACSEDHMGAALLSWKAWQCGLQTLQVKTPKSVRPRAACCGRGSRGQKQIGLCRSADVSAIEVLS